MMQEHRPGPGKDQAVIAVIGQRIPLNLTVYSFSLFAVEHVECSQRPIGVNAATATVYTKILFPVQRYIFHISYL